MRLYYSHCRNFGDALNPWMWPQLLTSCIAEDDTLFVGIGTLLNDKLPLDKKKIVFGAGVGYSISSPVVDELWDIFFVRGPLSARALGIHESRAISDPAILLRTINLPPASDRYRASFMPHWESTAKWDWRAFCTDIGVHFIDPAAPVTEVIADIRGSDLVITEAMHGAIVADALRVPWIPIQIYDHILFSKWVDWCLTLDLPYNPVPVPALFSPEATIRSARQSLRHTPLNKLLDRVELRQHRLARSAIRGLEMVVLRSQASNPITHSRLDTAKHLISNLSQSSDPILSSDEAIERTTERLVDKLNLLQKRYSM